MVKKENAMSDLEKELDFNDIAGGKSTKAAPVKKSKPKKEPPRKAGITLSIKQTTNKWMCKDIFECTAPQFVDWARGVYPVSLEQYVDTFESNQAKLEMFQRILHYHIHSLFQVGKKNQPSQSVN